MTAWSIRWPRTTRSPWCSNSLAPRWASSTDACASFICRTSESSPLAADEQQHPGARADAPDADDLARHVDEPVGAEQVAPVVVEAGDVLRRADRGRSRTRRAGRSGRADREPDQQRRDAAKARLAVDPLGELAHRPQARLAPRLRERLGEQDPALLAELAAEAADELARVDALVPDVEVAHLGKAAHRLAILAHARGHELPPGDPRASPTSRPAISTLAAIRLTSHSHGPGSVSSKSFGPKISLPVGSREAAEVRDVRVAAGLHDDAGVRRRREIGRHHRRGTAVERERRDEHPPVADRHELLQPRGRLGLQHRDRIRPVAAGAQSPCAARGTAARASRPRSADSPDCSVAGPPTRPV